MFLGYAPSHKGYLCFDLESGHFYVFRHVLFFEDSFPFTSSLATSSSPQQLTSNCLTLALLPTPHIPLTYSVSSTPLDAPLAPPFATSSKPLPSPIPVPFLSSNSTSPPSPVNTHHMVTRSYTQASNSTEWVVAMIVEYQGLCRNNTWCLVSSPSDAHVVGCRWIYKIK